MSRLCVKNLPKYLTEDRLRYHFAATGEVTDAKIIRTSDGSSRQFGFVGYKSEEAAHEALKYFQRSFIDTCRLEIELARPIGDSALPRPWSKHSVGSSAYVQEHPEEAVEKEKPKTAREAKKASKATRKGGDEVEADPEFQEFLEVVQPRRKSKLWANDTGAVARTERQVGPDVVAKENGHNEKDVLDDDESDEDSELYEDEPQGGTDDEEEGAVNDAVVKDEKVSDLEYLKSRVKSTWDDGEGDSQAEEEEEAAQTDDESDEGSDKSEEEAREVAASEGTEAKDLNERQHSNAEAGPSVFDGKEEEHVADTGRLFVRNLPYTATEDELRQVFEQYGELSDVHIVLDRETKRSKGLAYVLYMLPENALRAMEALDSASFQGRLLHILPARRAPEAHPSIEVANGVMAAGHTQVKEERQAQRKAAELGGDHRSWNALFMRSDTVAENVAQRYGVSKSELLDPEAGDLAVRMALGETHIIAETKKALEEQGVDVAALEKAAEHAGNKGAAKEKLKRSNHVLLVKNLPFATTEGDLVALFEKFGGLGRVVLPPTRTLALVEFLEAAEARRAFKCLAYKRFKHVPLYLEWAPEGVLTGDADSARAAAANRSSTAPAPATARAVLETAVHTEAADTATLFVKNLAFSTTEASLKQHFQKLRGATVRSVKIQTKAGKNGKQLSCGFGFVEFENAEQVQTALEKMQGSSLDGHSLVLQVSQKGGAKKLKEQEGKEKLDPGLSSTKLIVRNVAFEATKKDLRALFSPFGQIKSLRLPKKFDGSHRGFAFIEFVTKQEAQSAYEAVRDTHLYGRHIVLERAKEGEGLEELRERTAAQYHADEDGGLKKKRKVQPVQ